MLSKALMSHFVSSCVSKNHKILLYRDHLLLNLTRIRCNQHSLYLILSSVLENKRPYLHHISRSGISWSTCFFYYWPPESSSDCLVCLFPNKRFVSFKKFKLDLKLGFKTETYQTVILPNRNSYSTEKETYTLIWVVMVSFLAHLW